MIIVAVVIGVLGVPELNSEDLFLNGAEHCLVRLQEKPELTSQRIHFLFLHSDLMLFLRIQIQIRFSKVLLSSHAARDHF